MAHRLPLTTVEVDKHLRNFTVGILVLYLFFYGTVFEAHYPASLVELHEKPWWRLFVVCLVGLGTWWCPRVGLFLGIAAYLYLNDLQMLTTPFLGGTSL